jgi:hypothetical protein
VPANANHSARAICATVKSEGGGDLFSLSGFPFSAFNGATTKTVSTSFVPLVSIQLKAEFNSIVNRGLVLPSAYSLVTDNPIAYELRVNPALTNASFGSVDASSLCNFDVAATAISGGTIVKSEYATASPLSASEANVEAGYNFDLQLGVTIGGTSDVYTLAVRTISSTGAAVGSLAFYDLTA